MDFMVGHTAWPQKYRQSRAAAWIPGGTYPPRSRQPQRKNATPCCFSFSSTSVTRHPVNLSFCRRDLFNEQDSGTDFPRLDPCRAPTLARSPTPQSAPSTDNPLGIRGCLHRWCCGSQTKVSFKWSTGPSNRNTTHIAACGAPGSSRAELIHADRVTQPKIHPWRHRRDLPLSYNQRAALLGAAALDSYAQFALLNPQFTHGAIAATTLLQPAAPLGAAALNSYAQIALLTPQFTHGDIAATPILQHAAPLGAAALNSYAQIALLNPVTHNSPMATSPRPLYHSRLPTHHTGSLGQRQWRHQQQQQHRATTTLFHDPRQQQQQHTATATPLQDSHQQATAAASAATHSRCVSGSGGSTSNNNIHTATT